MTFIFSSQTITGHVLHCDGGKSLTSSGYVPWYGMDKMNRRFEPDYMSNLNYWMDKGKEKVKKSKFQPGSDEWLKEVQTSKWGINSEDAHSKPC
jgi:hypothetical protein